MPLSFQSAGHRQDDQRKHQESSYGTPDPLVDFALPVWYLLLFHSFPSRCYSHCSACGIGSADLAHYTPTGSEQSKVIYCKTTWGTAARNKPRHSNAFGHQLTTPQHSTAWHCTAHHSTHSLNGPLCTCMLCTSLASLKAALNFVLHLHRDCPATWHCIL